VELILKELGASATLIVACANDIYRKPRPGIWSLIPSYTGNEGLMIDSRESFVVGDAAGRKKDHSDSDLHLALNLGVDFYTPEVFFQDQAREPLGHKFDPSWYLTPHWNVKYDGQSFTEVQADSLAVNSATIADSRTRSLIVFVGLPGAGKTTFYNHFLAPLGYMRAGGGHPGALDNSEGVADGFLREGISV
jgi:bifunctional polynucleotide phosphatase/kinase